VSKSEAPGYIEIVIADHGTGIFPEDLPHVKEKFFKGNAGKPGSGIGLAVSDEIILMHNGSLNIESTLGGGTSVTILLPLTKKKA
jgi:signal transduction histidine kinase